MPVAEIVQGEALRQAQSDVARALTPYVDQLVGEDRWGNDSIVLTLFLNSQETLHPDTEITKYDLVINTPILGKREVKLGVFETSTTNEPYDSNTLVFSRNRAGNLTFRKIENNRGDEKDPLKLLADVKKGFEELPFVTHGKSKPTRFDFWPTTVNIS